MAFHECLVIDNSNFFKNGTIRVRIKTFLLDGSGMQDLSINPADSINVFPDQRYEEQISGDKKFKYNDEDVLVSSPMGVAFDYGLFYLPQPNTYGLVSDIEQLNPDESECNYVWVGGLYKMNSNTKNINSPSDNIYTHNGCNNGSPSIKNNSDIVFKHKETHIVDSPEKLYAEKTKKSLNWNLRPTQNMVVMDKNKIYLVHGNYEVNEDTKEEELKRTSVLEIGDNGGEISFKDEEGNINSKLNINNDGTFELSSYEKTDDHTINSAISSNSTGINISRYVDDSVVNVNLGSSYDNGSSINIGLKDKGDKVPTEVLLESGNGITINSNSNISINPGQGGTVSLGSGQGYILTSQSPGTFSLDNHTITAAKNVKA